MRILTLSEVGFTWRKPALLENINLAIDKGERIGLLGRNGTGKSTLMKILAGEVEPDHGQIRREPNTRISRLIQEVHTDEMLRDDGSPATIRDIALRGWQFDPTTTADTAHHHDQQWQSTAALDKVLSRMQLDGDLVFNSLSAGMKRRALLAQAIISNPDLLLLDEPTNHLDIDSILWLETFLKGFTGALLFVTHDRVFLQALSTRILEIDRGRLFDWECGYAKFLERKADALAAEEKQNELFDKRLAEEEVWIRKVSKPGGHATKVACVLWKPCGASVSIVATKWATSRCRRQYKRNRVNWSPMSTRFRLPMMNASLSSRSRRRSCAGTKSVS